MSTAIKVKRVAKPAVPKSHPPYADMVRRAVKELKERKGSSRQAIIKYIRANYKLSATDKVELQVKRALVASVKKGKLVHTKGLGASGSFKLTESAKKSPIKKKPAAKKAKSPKKKSATKKRVTSKKTPKKAAPAAGDSVPAPVMVKKPKKTPTKKAGARKPASAKKASPKKSKKSPVKKTIKKTPKKAVKKVVKK
jgi:histone H1/5